jgi:hypothetical protein
MPSSITVKKAASLLRAAIVEIERLTSERDALQRWKDDDLLDWDKLEARAIASQASEARMRAALEETAIQKGQAALSAPTPPIERLIEAARQLLETIAILGGANEPAELDRQMIGQELADALSAIGFGDKP